MDSLIQITVDYFQDLNMMIIEIFLLIMSFYITYRMIPLIIETVKYKKLMDHPNLRSSHYKVTPTLAGVAFFGSLIFCIFFIQNYDHNGMGYNLTVALTLLFFLGLKDDLMVLSAKTKILVQTIAIFFVLINPELQIKSFHGFLGLNELPLIFSIGISYFIVLYIINAYNLIDGIDGLAGMLGIFFSLIFSFFFHFLGLYFYSFIAVSITGFLLAFLKFNLSNKKKIFMGDTGSMMVGFLMGVLTLRFLSLKVDQLEAIYILPENVFIVSLSIIFFPIIDVIRVIIIRLLNKQKPFSPDRRHMHHVFIDKGLPHLKASYTFVLSNIIAFVIIYGLNSFFSYLSLSIIFMIFSIITFYLLLLLDTDPAARLQRKKIKPYVPKIIYTAEFRVRKAIIIFLKRVFYRNML